MTAPVSIPGFLNYWGAKLGKNVYGALADLSPVMRTRAQMRQPLSRVASGISQAYKQSGGMKLADYFRGFSAGENRETLSQAVRQRRQMWRVAVPGVLGAAAAGDMVLGRDNFVSRAASTVGSAGLALGMTGVAYRYGRLNAAVPMASVAAYNFLSRGNQIGPF